MSDIDELDELLGLIDEDEDIEEKKVKEIKVAKQQKNKDDRLVCPPIRCNLRVDAKTRAISSESLSLRLRHWKFVSLINLPLKLNNKCITNKEFVIIGILASKTIKTSKKNTKYLLIKVDDFNASILCFIFNAEIIQKFYKITEGTVLVVAGPQIMNDKNQNANNNNKNNNYPNNISLKIENNEQILIIGKSIDFAYCNKLLPDGHKKCPNVINKSKSDLCLFHKAKQYKKYASRRSDANRGTINLNRHKNNKRSLSGSMGRNYGMNNGITMIPTRKRISKTISARNYKENRKKTTNLLLQSKAVTPFLRNRLMKKCNKRGRNILETEEKNAKQKEMKKILAGKPLIPHLGSNWNTNNNKSNDIILLNPKSTPTKAKTVRDSQRKAQAIIAKKGIVFDAPNPNDTQHILVKKNDNRKRSFECMNGGSDKEMGSVRKKSRLGFMVSESDRDDIVNAKSVNDELRKELEKENVYKEMDALEEEEKLADELDEVTSVQVNVYVCKFRKCTMKDKIMEKMNDFCKVHSQNVVKSVGKKYFWRCNHCKVKTFTLNVKRVIPKCRRCGGRDFKSTSAYNLSKPKTNKKEKLVLVNNKK